MKAFAAIPLALFAGLQALIAWYWSHTTAAEQLKSVFTSMYGSVPAWSELAFSIGAGWLAAPIVIVPFLWHPYLQQAYGLILERPHSRLFSSPSLWCMPCTQYI